jgi:hypothetical protein
VRKSGWPASLTGSKGISWWAARPGVIRDPEDPEGTREVYVPRSKIKKVELQEGDRVTVIIG